MLELLSLLGRIFHPRPTPTPTPTPTPNPAITPANLTAAINEQRALRALSELKQDSRLDSLAAAWAAEMVKNGRLSHAGFQDRIATVYQNIAAAENVAVAQSIPKVVAMWMNSPGHRTNIMGDFTAMGSGFAASQTGLIYWCNIFAKV